jgi:hypothetical protein
MERSLLAVSPFDGANRIRFKGSPRFLIFDCGFAIGPPRRKSDTQSKTNPKSKLPWTLSSDLLQIEAPPKRYSIFKNSTLIVEPDRAGRKPAVG